MARLSRWTAGGFVLALSACAAAPSFDLSITRLSNRPDSLELVSGFAAPANVVVRDEAGLEELWSTIYASRSPRPPLPIVDFTRHLVIARAMGTRPTGGFSVVITGLLRRSGEYIVQVRETSPGPGCAVTLAQTSPVDVAIIARHDDPIRFAISTETRACG